MWFSRRQLADNVARWHASGWVTDDGRRAILAELDGAPRPSRLPTILAMLAAVLLGFAAMTFVAANWEAMSRLARLLLLLAGLWSAYGVAALLMRRRLDGFAHAAVLTGVALFGAGIMLVAQMYHLDGNPPDAVLLWAAGALVAGAALGSNPSLFLTMLLIVLWSVWETAVRGGVHFAFLPAWAFVTAVLWHRGSAPGLHLAAVAMAVWVVTLGYLLDTRPHPLVTLIGAAVAGAGIVAGQWGWVDGRRSLAMVAYGAAVAYAGLFALQFVERTSTGMALLLALVTLAGLLAALGWSARTAHRGITWVAYTGFSVEVLGIYGRTLGTLIGTSLFFLLTGLLLLALAVLAWWMNRRMTGLAENPVIEEGR